MSGAPERGGRSKKVEKRVVAVNRKARFEFEILDKVEAGLELRGTEVKSLRGGKASLDEAYVGIIEGEAFVVGMHIPEYEKGGYANHEPRRRRKLLLHADEIEKLHRKVSERGFTIIPLSLYFNERGIAKIEVALARGRRLHDKRDAIAEREGRKVIRDYEGRSRRG